MRYYFILTRIFADFLCFVYISFSCFCFLLHFYGIFLLVILFWFSDHIRLVGFVGEVFYCYLWLERGYCD